MGHRTALALSLWRVAKVMAIAHVIFWAGPGSAPAQEATVGQTLQFLNQQVDDIPSRVYEEEVVYAGVGRSLVERRLVQDLLFSTSRVAFEVTTQTFSGPSPGSTRVVEIIDLGDLELITITAHEATRISYCDEPSEYSISFWCSDDQDRNAFCGEGLTYDGDDADWNVRARRYEIGPVRVCSHRYALRIANATTHLMRELGMSEPVVIDRTEVIDGAIFD